MMRSTHLTVLIAVALVAAACSDSDGTADADSAPTATSTPRDNDAGADDAPSTDTPTEPAAPASASFEETPCWFEVPEGHEADCGYLVVPQDRLDQAGPTTRLAVARLLHPSGDPLPDPIVYLAGGPGERIVQVLDNAYEAFAELHASGRDVILFDQRGVGYSTPTLSCGIGAAYADVLDLVTDAGPISTREAGERIAELTSQCGADLAATTDLSDFVTAESAADVDALRQALGYEQLNLWGVSYGTRLAQEVMRTYPDGVRSVAIDAVMPPDLQLVDFVDAADRAFAQLFEGCRLDAACNIAFPDLDAVFEQTVADLDTDAPTLEVVNPVSGEATEVRLTGALFSTLLYQALYDTGTIPFLPGVIYATNAGDYAAVADAVPGIFALDQIQDFGMGLSVRYNQDRVQLPTVDEYDEATAAYPHLAGLIDLHVVFRPLTMICQDWEAGVADPTSWEPVISDIPTLVMTGEYDPNLAPCLGRTGGVDPLSSVVLRVPRHRPRQRRDPPRSDRHVPRLHRGPDVDSRRLVHGHHGRRFRNATDRHPRRRSRRYRAGALLGPCLGHSGSRPSRLEPDRHRRLDPIEPRHRPDLPRPDGARRRHCRRGRGGAPR